MEQELDHVVLGEELRDGWQRPSVDLLTALVDLVLLLALPELIDPAQAIVGGENLGRQARQQLFQGQPLVDGKLDIQQHVVNPKDLGEHTTGITSRQNEPVRERVRREPAPRIRPA